MFTRLSGVERRLALRELLGIGIGGPLLPFEWQTGGGLLSTTCYVTLCDRVSCRVLNPRFVLLREPHDRRVAPRLPDDLQTDGKTACVESARHADGGQTEVVREH